MIDRRKLLVQAAAIGTGATLPAAARAAPSTLRVVPQADLKILDPVWTTSQLTQAHALMVYDQLFALDSMLVPEPQMIETWRESSDGLHWSFTLRGELRFSDGSPVEAKDCVASIRRWAARTTDGQLLMRLTDGIEVLDSSSFSILAVWNVEKR